jgi:hypothetical protein
VRFLLLLGLLPTFLPVCSLPVVPDSATSRAAQLHTHTLQGLWTDDERRDVVNGIRPWLIQRAKLAAERAARPAAANADARGAARDQQGAAAAQQPPTEGPDAVWAAFIERARANIHWVLTMSPAGDAFRTRCGAGRCERGPALLRCAAGSAPWFVLP